jgi:hypothetical protein
MNDLAAPFGGYLVRDRRLRMRDHGRDLAAKALLIEPERGLALLVKEEIRIQLHLALLGFLIDRRLRKSRASGRFRLAEAGLQFEDE